MRRTYGDIMPKQHCLRLLTTWLASLLASGLQAAERQATPPSSITAADGFRVELLRSAQAGEGSWISMTMDAKGRIIVGIDDHGLGRLTINATDASADFQRLRNTASLQHVRGALFVDETLYVSATNSKAIYGLRDTDGDDQFDVVTPVKSFDYRSRYGHGTNQIVLGPHWPPPLPEDQAGDSAAGGGDQQRVLYIVSGNDVSFPEGRDPNSPYHDPRNDWLLPSDHDGGHDNRVGHIIRFDPRADRWTVLAGGLRNQYDVAFNIDGEMFTWDADMEWDAGLPWYRPTRLNHIVSGGEYGWRWGTGKWPQWYPDSLPTTLDTGLGSPTGMIFGTDSDWPQRYRQALFMADWQNGRILLVDLIPRGATYDAQSQLLLEGGPLNVCDLLFGHDGQLYFITGGRGSQSGLYRVSFVGDPNDAAHQLDPLADASDAAPAEHARARRIRHRLERYHTQQDAGALDFIWQHLGSEDRWLRFAARVALENQPLERWRDRVRDASDSLARRTALLALARAGQPSDQPTVIGGITAIDLQTLDEDQLLLPLRTLQLTLIRQGNPDEQTRRELTRRLDPLFPHQSFRVNWLLSELLVHLDAPEVIPRLVSLLQQALTQEEQIQYAKTLTAARGPWTIQDRREVLQWLAQSRRLPGGKLVASTIETIRSDIEQSLTEPQRRKLATTLARLDEPLDDDQPLVPPRPVVRQWTIDDLIDSVQAIRPQDHTSEDGLAALAAAACLRCHRVGDRGGAVGPDLTNVGKRLDARGLLEAILMPSKQVDPKYLHVVYQLADGRLVTGRPVGVNRNELTIETNPLTGESIRVAREEIEASRPAEISPMPEGLLDTLTRDEIHHLIAVLRFGTITGQ